MILDICADPDVLKTMRIVKLVINTIKVIVPIILIVMGSITFVGAIKDGSNSKALNKFIRQIVAAIAIFMIPTVIGITLKLVNDDSSYLSCFDRATTEGINAAYKEQIGLLMINAKTTLTEGNLMAVKSAINNMSDSPEKKELQTQVVQLEKEVQAAVEERNNKSNSSYSGTGISSTGKYTKTQIIDMSEEQVRAMSNQEFIEFIGSAAQIVYAENGGVLPSITIAQAILESGYGDHFEATSHNVYGLIGYPGNKPKVNRLRKFDNFYEATYYHYAYFQEYSNVYGRLLSNCANGNALAAADSLSAYAGGSSSYPSTIKTLINQYNLTQYDR